MEHNELLDSNEPNKVFYFIFNLLKEDEQVNNIYTWY